MQNHARQLNMMLPVLGLLIIKEGLLFGRS